VEKTTVICGENYGNKDICGENYGNMWRNKILIP
jgi:hypothetical protein